MEILKTVKRMTEVKKFVSDEIWNLYEPMIFVRRFVHCDGHLECMDLGVEVYECGEYLGCIDVYTSGYQDKDLSLDESFMLKELKQVAKYVETHFKNKCEIRVFNEIHYA